MLNILVTGGLGFIGSHVVTELILKGHNVVIIDNESNSSVQVLKCIHQITSKHPTYYKVDMESHESIARVFNAHSFDCVIHLAGLKAVGESVEQPLKYYRTNLNILLNLLDVMSSGSHHQVKQLIFSSSATVYGSAQSPFTEDTITGMGMTNPYGKTKYFQEEIIKDYLKGHPKTSRISVVILRYFNPIGAHPSGLLKENLANPPQNLMPILIKVASGLTPFLRIYGNDYDTPDGTCIRDYIHIVDLAKAHVKSLDLMNRPGLHIYNIGTGDGVSVKKLVDTFKQVNKIDIPIEYADRRPGDISTCCAVVTRANEELGWKSELSLENMCIDSWKPYQMSIL